MSEQTETDRVAFDAFTLALRVVLQAYELELPASEFEKPWRLVREVARGETTLTSTAELAVRFPALSEFLYERANRMIESDRVTATRVLRGLGESL